MALQFDVCRETETGLNRWGSAFAIPVQPGGAFGDQCPIPRASKVLTLQGATRTFALYGVVPVL